MNLWKLQDGLKSLSADALLLESRSQILWELTHYAQVVYIIKPTVVEISLLVKVQQGHFDPEL